ncbi:MAG: hypothetical protein PUP91_28790 [Rhizonema sp. PD37]|nr:hypothetical protein [Rhizonema sp. PD37]
MTLETRLLDETGFFYYLSFESQTECPHSNRFWQTSLNVERGGWGSQGLCFLRKVCGREYSLPRALHVGKTLVDKGEKVDQEEDKI